MYRKVKKVNAGMVKKSALQMAAQISGHGPYSGMI